MDGRWHPFFFRHRPRPSEYEEYLCRYTSVAHHTEGFESYDDAFKEVMNMQNKYPERYTFDSYSCTLDGDTTDTRSLDVYLVNEGIGELNVQ